MTQTPIAISWSGGKDSSMMLHQLMNDEQYEIVELHTAISSETGRVSMHGVSQELIRAQAESIGLPIHFISIEPASTNANYEKALNQYYSNLKSQGIHHIGFGDIFLEDLKAYRDQLLHDNGLIGIYPLWKKETKDLANYFLDQNFKTLICCAKQSLFPESICGKTYSQAMLEAFDTQVDPCGENGEFHSYAFDGPIFNTPISITVNETIVHTYEHKLKSGEEVKTAFEFADLTLAKRAVV
ncbi:ATP-binding protein [Reichenbachiella carrageenanivorans]|uniref:ATP-binding protein n=1 Tax=Reichenbachiella carrageenanivorans TaxID=2979869 RepID=A0ABY6D2L5_9BACT|nr:ATP-binding protein [Reichenbachiella carrageenanivorans]UXX78080.1 ATP-binding protein [Reichenbachiella carrageenanivorans]